MMEVYDRVINSRSHATLAYMLGGVIVVYLVTELLDWVRAKMLLASSLRLDADLRNMAFNSMFESRRMGATSSSPHVLGDVRTLREFVCSSVVQAFLDTPISIVFLVLVFFIHPSMAIFALDRGIAAIGHWRAHRKMDGSSHPTFGPRLCRRTRHVGQYVGQCRGHSGHGHENGCL